MKAAEKLMCVLVDCDWGKKNRDLMDQYRVKSYPTVVFADADGKQVEKMKERDAETVRAQIERVAARHTRAATVIDSWDKAQAVGKKEKRPVLYFFSVSNDASKRLETALGDRIVRKARAKFVLVRSEIKKESPDAVRFRVENSATAVVLVLDPREEKPEEKQYRLPPDARTPMAIRDWLDAVLKKFEEK
ncbi:MAG: hypothetical protein HYY17_01030 [Planctomycetes bacterium]|nr:hypothetical protein [Planctomycetota bacterium]